MFNLLTLLTVLSTKHNTKMEQQGAQHTQGQALILPHPSSKLHHSLTLSSAELWLQWK